MDRTLPFALGALLCLHLAGCGTPSTQSRSPSAASTASTASTASSGGGALPGGAGLAGEGRWLRELFNGTPVVIADEAFGVLRLSVPVAHSFDPGSSVPKPALKAVLDRVAQSMGRQGTVWVQVGAPGPMAASRHQAMKGLLLGQKLAPWRVTNLPSAAPADAVVLRLLPS